MSGRIFSPVDPVYRIPKTKVDSKALVERAITRFQQFESDRVSWLVRREEFYLGWDDYLSSTRKGPWEGSSNVHLPMTEIQCNLMHARIMQAFFFIEPWFFVEPQEEIDIERIKKIELMMKYIVMRYANYHNGIYSAIDDWAWDLVTDGVGILSRDWRIEQRKFFDIVEDDDFKTHQFNLDELFSSDHEQKEFEDRAKQLIKLPYKEVSKVRTVFNGPLVRAENPAYILFKGDVVDATDLNQHETIIKVCYFSKDDLIGFQQSEFMDADVIDELLESAPTPKGSGMASSRTSRLEHYRDHSTGIKTQGKSLEESEYEFLCVYDRVGLDGNASRKSVSDELVYFVPTQTQKLARWTFLDRHSSNGKRPLHMAHLYKRPRRSIGRGLVETQYALNETADLLINQSIDAGLLANQPMFGFKGNSTFDPDVVRTQPGMGFKMDDPNNDLRFFTWNVNPNWSQGVQALIQSFSQQLTSLGPLASGQVGSNVGPLRSGVGVQSLLGETGTNLDVVIRRAKMCYSDFLEGIYSDCIQRMPSKMKLTVLGAEGEPVLDADGRPTMVDVSREELHKRVHFGLYANSQNMNRQAQEVNAMKLAQFLLQRVAIESGVVKPENIYEIYNHVIKTMGTQQAYRFISKPQNQISIPVEAELLMIMQGIKPPVVMNDREHQAKIDKMTEILNSEKSALEVQYGAVNKDALKVLEWAIGKHEQYLSLLQQPTNLENPTGSNQSPALAGADATAQQEALQGGQPTGAEAEMQAQQSM